MSFLHAVPGKEAEFNAAVDEWEAFAATKRGTSEWERFPFMSGVSKVPVPTISRGVSSSVPTSGPAVFAPPDNATREEVGQSMKEVYATYAPGGAANARLEQLTADDSVYMRMIRKRFDLCVARAFGSKHVHIVTAANKKKWAEDGKTEAECADLSRDLKAALDDWSVGHVANLKKLSEEYAALLAEAGEDGIDDGVDIDLLTQNIASGKMEEKSKR